MRLMLQQTVLFAALLVMTSPAGAVTFDDGQVHVIDAANSFPFEGVTVLDSSLSVPTTVMLIDGGEIGTSISGAAISLVGDTSVFEMHGGILEGTLTAAGMGRVLYTGGQVDRIEIDAQSSAEISMGEVPNIIAN
jgi:hypothetical protein